MPRNHRFDVQNEAWLVAGDPIDVDSGNDRREGQGGHSDHSRVLLQMDAWPKELVWSCEEDGWIAFILQKKIMGIFPSHTIFYPTTVFGRTVLRLHGWRFVNVDLDGGRMKMIRNVARKEDFWRRMDEAFPFAVICAMGEPLGAAIGSGS